MGLELSGVIDPDLNWKTATKGRRRAVRRARTSFLGENRKKCTVKTPMSSKDIADKESMGDVSVSESEKVGVSILGQRFSESLKSVPIKKRRFLLSCSSSPLPPASHSDYSDDFSKSQMDSFQGTSACERNQKRRLTSNKRSNFRNINDKICDAADFYGISILASAACNSDTVGDIMNDEGLNSKDHSSKGEVLSNLRSSDADSSFEEKAQHMLIAEDLEKKCNLPMETCSAISVEVIDGLASNKSSMTSLQDASDKVKHPSCYPKHNWDLNMDVWDNNCDEIANCQPLAIDHGIESSQSERKSVRETRNSQVDAACVSEFGSQTFDVVGSLVDNHVVPSQSARKSVHETSNSEEDGGWVSEFENHNPDVGGGLMDNDIALKAEAGKEHDICKAEAEKEHDISTAKSIDSEEAKQCSFSCGYHSEEINQHLDVASASVGSNEETTPVNDRKIYLCGAKDVSATDEAFCSHAGKSGVVSKSVQMEPITTFVSGENERCHTTSHKSLFSLGESVSERVWYGNADENKSTDKSNVESNSDDHFLIDSLQGSLNILKSESERNLDMLNSDNINDYPSTNHLDNVDSEDIVDGNVCRKTNATYDISGEVLTSDYLVMARKHHDDESYRVGTDPCPSSTVCCDTTESHNNEMFPSGTGHDGKYEMGRLDQKTGDHKCATFDLLSTNSDDNGHNNTKACIPMAPGTTQLDVDTDMVDDAVGVKVESNCHLDSCVKNPENVGLDDKLGCASETNAANNYACQANLMEKIDLVEDDSQYEDGEFRESVLHGWGDAAEEEEIEHLDYGSDYRENDVFEPPSSVPTVDSTTCKGVQVATHDAHSNSCKDMQLTIYQPLPKGSSMSEGLNSAYGKSGAGRTQMDYLGLNDGRKSQKVDGGASLSDTVTDNITGDNIDDCNKETLTSTRMKMSGWDQLPESHRHNIENLSDTGITSTKNHSDSSFDAVGTSGSLIRSCSSFRRDLSSRIEKPSSSDEARRSYGRVSRSDDHNDLSAKAEGDTGVPNSSGRHGPSLHAQGRDRGESWFEPSNHCVPRNHDSSAYYSTHRFSQSGLRNAAAAAVAKVESNGFVVAPDGTLVKVSGVGPAGRLPRRSGNDPLHASRHSISGRGSSSERNHTCDGWKRLPRPREMSPDRHFTDDRDRVGRYDHEMVRNRYHRHVPDNDSNLDLLHLPRRGRNFSPPRGNMRLSRSRSRSTSRSRTRSPRHWTSPKGGVRMNGGPVLRRRSRSPLIFKQDARMRRMRSPHQRTNYGDHHIMAYGPRIRASLPHAPSGSRKESPDHLRELEYRQDSGSTATMRMLRNQRFDSMDSQGRLKPDEYYCPLPSRKAPKYAAFGRGSDLDRIQDRRRGHADKYEPRKHDMNSSIKRAHYDVEESFKNRSMGFQRTGSPGNFDRRTHNRLEDSPDKVKEEKVHFRYDDKFSKPRTSFNNSYEAQEREIGVASQGRSS